MLQLIDAMQDVPVFMTAAIGLVLIPLVLLLARWWATTHARLAARMLANVDSSRINA